jgi:membrane protease YdiL (CAAX protease family)
MSAHPFRLSSEKLSVLLRVSLFVLIAWSGLILFPGLISGVTGDFTGSALSTFAAAAVANAILVRIYQHGQLSGMGLGWTETSARDLFTGMAAAAAAAVVIVAAALFLQMAAFESAPRVENAWANLTFVTLVLLFGAAGEEMLFHGYAFQILVRSLGQFATILPVAVLFGLMHLNNRNVTALAVVNTMAWGVLLGYAYVRTSALWLPIGLHFGWNAATPLLGVNLSGFTIGVTGYQLHWRTGILWSGGGYGLEGSLFTTAIVIALFFVVNRVVPERSSPEEGVATEEGVE